MCIIQMILATQNAYHLKLWFSCVWHLGIVIRLLWLTMQVRIRANALSRTQCKYAINWKHVDWIIKIAQKPFGVHSIVWFTQSFLLPLPLLPLNPIQLAHSGTAQQPERRRICLTCVVHLALELLRSWLLIKANFFVQLLSLGQPDQTYYVIT